MGRTFDTVDVLSTATGVLLDDIGGVYRVVSYLVGRDVFIHELVTYGKQAAAAIKAAVPSVPTKEDGASLGRENFKTFRDDWLSRLGRTIELPDSLSGCLADGRNAVDTLADLGSRDKIIVVDQRKE